MLSDKVRAAIMVFVGNIVTALVLFAIVDWSAEQVATVNAIVNSGLVVLALVVPSQAGATNTVP